MSTVPPTPMPTPPTPTAEEDMVVDLGTSTRARLRRTAIATAVMLTLIALGGLSLLAGPAGGVLDQFDTAGAQAPDFTLPTLAGDTMVFSDQLGAPLVVNFGASWCAECEEEAPVLAAAWRRWEPEGVRFLGVAVQDPARWAQDFADRHGLGYEQALDDRGDVMRRWGVVAVPETLFIAPDGRVLAKWVGPLDEQILDLYIQRMLDAVADTSPADPAVSSADRGAGA